MLTSHRCGQCLPSARPASKPFRSLRADPKLHSKRRPVQPCRALEIDWTDQTTWTGLLGAVLGIGLGIGVPVFYISRDQKDRDLLEQIREMNRKRFEETGEYMSEEEIAKLRTPRWTDNREFADDD